MASDDNLSYIVVIDVQVAEVTSQECPFRPTTGRAPSAPRLRGNFADRAMEYQSKV